jgi:hypothetical protein
MQMDDRDEFMSRAFCETFDAAPEERAPSRLKARAYSAIVRAQQKTGPLQSLTQSEVDGYRLCVFEKLVQIAPIGEQAKSPFFCSVCHARVLAERMENAPIYWPNCPYAVFQNR